MNSGNLYVPKSNRDPESFTSRNIVDSRSKVPRSLRVLGIIITLRKKGSGSNLDLRITSVLNIDFTSLLNNKLYRK
jgi:hypothetical protein